MLQDLWITIGNATVISVCFGLHCIIVLVIEPFCMGNAQKNCTVCSCVSYVVTKGSIQVYSGSLPVAHRSAISKRLIPYKVPAVAFTAQGLLEHPAGVDSCGNLKMGEIILNQKTCTSSSIWSNINKATHTLLMVASSDKWHAGGEGGERGDRAVIPLKQSCSDISYRMLHLCSWKHI